MNNQALNKRQLLSRRLAELFLGVSLLTPFANSQAVAATYYWDNNGTAAGFGTAGGTWTAPTLNQWSTDATGVAAPGVSISTATSDAENFGTATDGLLAGTITVSGAVSSGNVTFGAASGLITLSGGSISFGASTITVNNAQDIINSTLTGGNALTKAGTGTLVLGGTNTRTGKLTISNGILSVSDINDYGVAGGLGAQAATTIDQLGAGSTAGTLQYTGALASTNRQFQIGDATAANTGGGVISNTGTGKLTFTAATFNPTIASITATRNLAFGGTADIEVQGAIQNNATGGLISLTKTGSNTVTLNGANTNTGALTVSAGTLNLSGAKTGASGVITVGSEGNTAVMNLSNGSYAVGTANIFIGTATTGGTGTVNQTGGTVSFTGGNGLLIGNGAAGTGIYNLSGGTVTSGAYSSTTRGVMLGVNTGSSGTFNLSDSGNLALASSTLQVGRFDSAANNTTALFNQTGGTATVSRLSIGGNGTTSTGLNATFTITGGTFAATSFAGFGAGNTNTTVMNIGGTADITLPAFPTARGTGATATINFDGGTLKNVAASATYMGGLTNAFIKAGGATFDTSAGNITITQALLTDLASTGGGLTKMGSNTLTLSGANTYTGVTNINVGAIALGNTNALGTTAGATIVAAGAEVFAGAPANGLTIPEAFTIAGFGTAANNGAIHTGGNATVSFSGNVTLAGDATLKSDGGSTANFSGQIDTTASGYALTASVGGSNTMTISGNIIGTGSLLKTNLSPTSTLAITGTGNTYTGATTIEAGTLALTGAGAINTSSGITINDGKLLQTSSVAVSPAVTLNLGTLTGSGTVNTVGVADNAGAIISNNNGMAGAALTIGTLTFNGAGTINTFSATTAAPIVTTSLATNVAGTVTINPTPATLWTNGATYDLVSYGGGSIGGAGFGQIALGTVAALGARQTATLGNSGTAITMAIAGDTPYWVGDGDGKWNTTSVNNWKLITAATYTTFLPNDGVIFNDNATGSGPFAIDIDAADVATSSVTFNNSTKDYTINSSNGFGISSGLLIKNGAGSVTINTTNTYTGSTTLNAGTLNISTAGVAGTSGPLGNGGTLVINGGTLDNTSGGALTVLNVNPITVGGDFALSTALGTANNSLALPGAVNLGGATRTITTNGAAELTLSGVISNGGLTKAGTGALTLSGANTYTGPTALTTGITKLGNASALGTGTSAADGTTISAGATLDLGGVSNAQNSSTGSERITVSGSGVGGLGAITSSTAIATPFIGVRYLTLAGDTTLGFSNRWDVGSSTAANNGFVGGGYTLNVLGTGPAAQASLNFLGETDLGDINVNLGSVTATNILFLQGTTTLGRPAHTVTITGGSALEVFSNSTITNFDKKFVLDNGTITVRKTGGTSLDGTISLVNANTLASITATTVTNVISGAGSLTKTGASALSLTGVNTYTGDTTVSTGTLSLDGAGQLGSGTYAGAINDAGTLLVNTTASQTLSGVISGAGGLSKSNTGTLTLTGTNTFTGAVSLTNGTVVMANTQALGLPVAAVTLNGGVTLDIATAGSDTPYNFTTGSNNTATIISNVASGTTGINHTLGSSTIGGSASPGGTRLNIIAGAGITSGTPTITIGSVTMSSGTAAAVITTYNPTTADLIIAGNVTNSNGSATNTRTLNLDGTAAGNQITGVISNGASAPTLLTKSNTSTWTLTGDSTYTGTTAIEGGKLLVNGNNTVATGAVSVSALATLGGSGVIGGTTTVASTGIIAPGNSTGNLTFAAGVELNAGGVYQWELGALSVANPGTDFDTITVSNGNMALGGSSALTLDFGLIAATGPNSADPFWTSARTWKIMDVTGLGTNTGDTNLSTITNASYSSGSFTTTVGAGADAGDIFLVFTPGVVVGPSVWQGANNDNWTAAGSWSGSVPNSNSAEAKFVTTGGTTAVLNANQTVNKLTFDATAPHTISGASTLTLAGTTPMISTAGTNTATQTVAVNLDLAAGTAINVQGGTLELNSPANAVLGTGVTATVANGATLSLGGTGNALSNGTSTHANVANSGTLLAMTPGKRVGNIDGTGTTTVTAANATLTANHVRQATLNIGAGNTVTIASNGGDTGTSTLTNLNINATGKLDLNDNDLIVKNGNLTTLTAQLATGLDINGNYGGGPGITSTAFASNMDFNTVLGIAANSDLGYTSFSGQTVGINDVLIKYTYYGDADLSGSVDTSTDFDLYITGLTSGGSLGGWLFGDFDYSGTVDSSTDFDLYITGLTSQGSPLLTAGGSGGNLVQAVPEPSTFVLGGLALLGFAGVGLRRRRLARK